MRTAQELRAAADLLCSEIEENQILFSYYEFTEDEQEVILEHFIEYLNGKKAVSHLECVGETITLSELSFSYLDSFFSISMRPWPFDSINLHTYIEGIGWSVMKISFGLDDNRWWTYYTKLVLNEFLLQSKENPLKTTA
jgi:hypothetical protein